MVEAEGESSGGEEESAAEKSRRVTCGQFVWPCLRQYPTEVAERRRRKWLIPADLTKEQFGYMFKDVCIAAGHGPNIDKLHVFDEPHKRFSKLTGAREIHKHLVFNMKATFAHYNLQNSLAARGVY